MLAHTDTPERHTHTQPQPLHTLAVYLESQGHEMATAGSPWLQPKKGMTFPSGSKLDR